MPKITFSKKKLKKLIRKETKRTIIRMKEEKQSRRIAARASMFPG